jgi:hypothetical protein
MFFSFTEGGGVMSAHELCWIIFPWRVGGRGEPHEVCDAHLFLLQFHAGSFGSGWWGEMALIFFFGVVWHREVFHRLGVQDDTGFDSY